MANYGNGYVEDVPVSALMNVFDGFSNIADRQRAMNIQETQLGMQRERLDVQGVQFGMQQEQHARTQILFAAEEEAIQSEIMRQTSLFDVGIGQIRDKMASAGEAGNDWDAFMLQRAWNRRLSPNQPVHGEDQTEGMKRVMFKKKVYGRSQELRDLYGVFSNLIEGRAVTINDSDGKEIPTTYAQALITAKTSDDVANQIFSRVSFEHKGEMASILGRHYDQHTGILSSIDETIARKIKDVRIADKINQFGSRKEAELAVDREIKLEKNRDAIVDSFSTQYPGRTRNAYEGMADDFLENEREMSKTPEARALTYTDKVVNGLVSRGKVPSYHDQQQIYYGRLALLNPDKIDEIKEEASEAFEVNLMTEDQKAYVDLSTDVAELRATLGRPKEEDKFAAQNPFKDGDHMSGKNMPAFRFMKSWMKDQYEEANDLINGTSTSGGVMTQEGYEKLLKRREFAQQFWSGGWFVRDTEARYDARLMHRAMFKMAPSSVLFPDKDRGVTKERINLVETLMEKYGFDGWKTPTFQDAYKWEHEQNKKLLEAESKLMILQKKMDTQSGIHNPLDPQSGGSSYQTLRGYTPETLALKNRELSIRERIAQMGIMNTMARMSNQADSVDALGGQQLPAGSETVINGQRYMVESE